MRRGILLALSAIVVFAIAAFLMIRLMPQPLKDSDYLVAGSVATLVAMLVLFLALVSTSMKAKDVFFKRRRKRS
jgi:ABC-type Fe3+-siderophore transport system permease subunit